MIYVTRCQTSHLKGLTYLPVLNKGISRVKRSKPYFKLNTLCYTNVYLRLACMTGLWQAQLGQLWFLYNKCYPYFNVPFVFVSFDASNWQFLGFSMLLSLCVCIYGQLEPELECIKFSRTQRVAKMGEIDLWEESKSKSLTRVEAGAKSDNESLIRLCSRMKAKITMQQSDGKKSTRYLEQCFWTSFTVTSV